MGGVLWVLSQECLESGVWRLTWGQKAYRMGEEETKAVRPVRRLLGAYACEEAGSRLGYSAGLQGRGETQKHFTRTCWFTSLPLDSTFPQSALPETSCFDVGRCYRKEPWAEQHGNMVFLLFSSSEP